MANTGSVDLEYLLFGTIFLYVGGVGVVKSILILFFKKELVLPLFSMYFFIMKLVLGRKHSFCQKWLTGYRKMMKPLAICYLIILPFLVALGVGGLMRWFQYYIF